MAQDLATKDINFNFENVSLELFLKEMSSILKASLIYDSQIKEGSNKGEGGFDDVKITFRTNRPFNLAQCWSVVDSFLDLAGLARVKISEQEDVFRITKIDTARKEALPSFIGIEPDKLPDSGLIRYVYFLKNSSAEQMSTILQSLKGKSALLSTYNDLNALIFTDQAYNIKTLMRIVQELDSACTPVRLSVLKLKEADAQEVAKLYEDLKSKGGTTGNSGFGINKQSNQNFLHEASVFAEPRTNALIIIGTPEATARIEKFIIEHVDTKLAKRRSGIHTVELNYIPAQQIAEIFNNLTKFGSSGDPAKLGGLRGGEKYFNRMFFEAEKQGNSLIVRGEEEDFIEVQKIIKDLDRQQSQVAIEVLIVSLETNNKKGITSQIDNKKNGNVNFQTSGFGGTGGNDGSGILLSPTNSLAANLISLATNASLGTTVLSLGKNTVWALLGILNQDAKTNVLSNPFLVTTNKYPAFTSIGEVRRVTTEQIIGGSTNPTPGQGNISADLEVRILPRISSLGEINLNIDIIIENFTEPLDPSNGNKSSKDLHTNANLADGEVLAIGGLSRDTNRTSNSSVPILSKIPIIGNFFKNKQQVVVKENLVVFIIPRIIRPGHNLNAFTKNKANYATGIMSEMDSQFGHRDPITKWLFKDNSKEDTAIVDDFIAKHKDRGLTSLEQAQDTRNNTDQETFTKRAFSSRKAISNAVKKSKKIESNTVANSDPEQRRRVKEVSDAKSKTGEQA